MSETKNSNELIAKLNLQRRAMGDQFRDTADHLRQFLDLLERYQRSDSPKKGEQFVRQSFEILKLKMLSEIDRLMSACQALDQPIELPDFELEGEDVIEEYWDDNVRSLGRQIRDQLLSIIEVLDHLDMLDRMDIPETDSRQYRYQLYRQLRNRLRPLRAKLEAHLLATYRVAVIEAPDLVGKYPPPEFTSIAFREDDSRSNYIIVSRVLHNGYSWNGTVIRKILVAVTSKKETV